MKEIRRATVMLAIALGIANVAAQCYLTTQPDCSVYFPGKYYSCESGGVYSVTTSGGLPMDKCTPSSYGAVGCQNENPTTCTFAWTITNCDGSVSTSVLTNPVTPTEDNGLGPCP